MVRLEEEPVLVVGFLLDRVLVDLLEEVEDERVKPNHIDEVGVLEGRLQKVGILCGGSCSRSDRRGRRRGARRRRASVDSRSSIRPPARIGGLRTASLAGRFRSPWCRLGLSH